MKNIFGRQSRAKVTDSCVLQKGECEARQAKKEMVESNLRDTATRVRPRSAALEGDGAGVCNLCHCRT
jgi:hypothetical protein